MGKYGIHITNYQAASIYEYQFGFRENLDSTKAMLTNSLFLDYLLDNDLISVWKDEFTRDVICVEFGYGTKSYEQTKAKLEKTITDESTTEAAREHLRSILNNVEKNKKKCVKISADDLRVKFYCDGFPIEYKTRDKKGNIIRSETIYYKMLYRTPGKAKKGTCMFINAEVYEQVHDFLYMGIKLPKHHSPIVEMGAYSSLITSAIIDRIQIKPEQILIVKDVDSFFETSVVEINIDAEKHCIANHRDGYQVKNTLFDGQALIDSSIFPDWASGYVLLRHHLTKMAAFNTHIEAFMRDQFGKDYETATVTDMFGRKVRVRDIKLITTNNAVKWLKFGVKFDYWADWVRKNDCMFGIVKSAHESKLGDVQRMSYQMMNALDLDSMPQVVSATVDYIEKLKTDDKVFLDYLEKNQTFSNDFEVLVALARHNTDFVRSEYFRDRRKQIISTYVLNFKSGHGIQNADNLTIVGSPYAMLLYSIGKDVLEDPTFQTESGTIQCWTSRFADGAYLAEFRSPFNSRNNLGYLRNHYHEYFDKYFDFGKLIVAVNMIGNDFQSRNNGSDMDSDSIYVTNQPEIIAHARYCYKEYATIVNSIPEDSNIYDYSMVDFARVDNTLAAAQLAIGESSNLAQLALTYTYNFPQENIYSDATCILSVIAQIAIDNAKRKYDVDLNAEISRIKKTLDIQRNGLPKFWLITKKDKRKMRNEEQRRERDRKNREKIRRQLNPDLQCPMNYLYEMDLGKSRNRESTLPMSDFWVKYELSEHRRKSEKVERLIQEYSWDLFNYNVDEAVENDDYKLLLDGFEKLVNDIRSIYISKNYLGMMSWLINRAFLIGSGTRGNAWKTNSTLNKNKALLLKVLYSVNPSAFLQCFQKKVATN